jgi:hypothetical protein
LKPEVGRLIVAAVRITALKSLLALLTVREKRQGALVLVATVLMALVETAGVASIMPFLAVLGNPGLVETNAWLAELYRLGGFASHQAFLFALGAGALAVVLTAAIIRAGGVRRSHADIAKAQRLLGYSPSHTLEQGLGDLVNWYFTSDQEREASMGCGEAVTRDAPRPAMRIVSQS